MQLFTTLIPNTMVLNKEDENLYINGICVSIDKYSLITTNSIEVHFCDNTSERYTYSEESKLDIGTGIRFAIAKHIGKEIFNEKGIEYLANYLSYLKCIDKIIENLSIVK